MRVRDAITPIVLATAGAIALTTFTIAIVGTTTSPEPSQCSSEPAPPAAIDDHQWRAPRGFAKPVPPPPPIHRGPAPTPVA